ncbi:MAG: PAS domain S-box protein [Bacteroidia bacterium]
MKNAGGIRILLVDDDSGDHLLFKESLNDIKGNCYVLTWADTYEKGVELINKKEHEIYFFDYLLGAKTGLDLLRESVRVGIQAPIILLTGLGNPETDRKAMELGASDYLVKDDIDPEKLERSIRYSIEQSRLLKGMSDSERKFRSIFENSHDVIYLSDQTGRIIDINRSAERLFGYTREEMLKMNAADFYLNREERERFVKEINQYGSCSNFEVILVDRAGQKKYCTLTANIQMTDESGMVYYQGIVHDMTKRRKAERDLMIAEKLAITGKIARSLAHEIRNPLTNINLSVEQLQEYMQDEDHRQYFDIVKRNSKRINDLVTQLMENSKPAELDNSSYVPLSQILNSTVELAADRARLKNITILKEFRFGNERVFGDAPKLTIALLNILMNAIEAVEANTGVIKIDAHCDSGKCYIIVGDNGCGITADNISRVFDPYFTSKSNGMGLGLATTHNIINIHRGKIDIESEVDKGTRFTIELDLA